MGLTVKMLTGDHALTAASIGQELGLDPADVHARFTPADKLELVERLQEAGEVVAVTGDGVNDAPALRQADVGIAMGGAGTEAAREASMLVLTDDDFASIVAAVEEGRRVSANVRSFLAFLLSANVGEVVLFGIAVAAGLGVPMTVVQVLVVNLLTDGPPAVALAADRATEGRSWMRRGQPLLARPLVAGLLLVAGLIGIVIPRGVPRRPGVAARGGADGGVRHDRPRRARLRLRVPLGLAAELAARAEPLARPRGGRIVRGARGDRLPALGARAVRDGRADRARARSRDRPRAAPRRGRRDREGGWQREVVTSGG